MVKQADGWESGLSVQRHREIAASWRWFIAAGGAIEGDSDTLAIEYHEACAEGHTTAATEDE